MNSTDVAGEQAAEQIVKITADQLTVGDVIVHGKWRHFVTHVHTELRNHRDPFAVDIVHYKHETRHTENGPGKPAHKEASGHKTLRIEARQ